MSINREQEPLFPSRTLLGIGRSAGLLCLAAVTLAGCQTFKSEPLDLQAHDENWRNRVPESESVREFAKRLADRDSGAATFNPSDGVTLDEGELVALVFNPELRVARLRAGVAEAAAEFAGRWDDPELAVDVLKITEGVPDPWIVGSALSITVPLSGRLRVEKARAAASLHAELDRVVEAEWRVHRDLRNSWLSWSANRLRLEQTEAIVKELDSIVESTTRLAEGGELLKTEAALFAIERESRRAELAQLRSKVAEEEQEIRALLGLSPTAPAKFIPTLSAASPPASGEKLEETNPTLTRLRSEHLVAEKVLLREIRKQYPDITIGPQGESDEGQSRVGFVGAIPIPILNSNRGGIAEARAKREVARAAFETEYERIVGRIAALRARLEGVRTGRRTLDKNLVPLVDRQVADARRLMELGEGGSLVLLESLVRAHEAKMKLIQVQFEGAQSSNEIRFLIGPDAPN